MSTAVAERLVIPLADPLRVLIGAGEQRWEGWIATHREQLDLPPSGTVRAVEAAAPSFSSCWFEVGRRVAHVA